VREGLKAVAIEAIVSDEAGDEVALGPSVGGCAESVPAVLMSIVLPAFFTH
jgi:hypothetical protein